MPINPEINLDPKLDPKDKEADLTKLDAQSNRFTETPFEEALVRAETEDDVIFATRGIMRMSEKWKFTPEDGSSEYEIRRPLKAVSSRETALGYSVRELIDKKIITKLNEDNTGEARFGGFEIYGIKNQTFVLESCRVDQKTRQPILDGTERYRPSIIEVPYFGTPEERERMEKAYERASAEIAVRYLIHELYKSHSNNTENIDGLANFYLYSLPFADGLGELFDLPEENGETTITKTDAGVELRKGHEFGDKIETAYRAYEIISLSEKPGELKKLTKKPGWKKFMFPNAEQEAIWVGNIDQWARETQEVEKFTSNSYEFSIIPGERTGKEDVANELAQHTRGRLTKYGNIFTSQVPQTSNEIASSQHRQIEEIRGEVRKLLGGDKSAIDAEQEAWRLFRLNWMATENGYEIYKRSKDFPNTPKKQVAKGIFENSVFKGVEVVTDMGGETSDDTFKVLRPDLFQANYTEKGRDPGPLGSLFKSHRFAVSFFRTVTSGEGQNERSYRELMWGAPQETIDEVNYPEEQPLRIGELPWDENFKIMNKHYLTTFMGGRKEIGTFQQVTNSSPELKMLNDGQAFRRFWKQIGVGVPRAVVVKGEFRGKDKDLVDSVTEIFRDQIWQNYWTGLETLPQLDELRAKEGEKYVSINRENGEQATTIRQQIDRIKDIARESGFSLPNI